MRYIDADAFKQKLADKNIFFPALFKNELDDIPTADVVPKSEVAREIFEEIEKYWIKSDILPDCVRLVDLDKIAELKNKYTEADNGETL